jgi:hypothetical protein
MLSVANKPFMPSVVILNVVMVSVVAPMARLENKIVRIIPKQDRQTTFKTIIGERGPFPVHC